MTKKIITLSLIALAAYVVANQARTGGGYEKSGYQVEDGDYEEKSNEKEASISSEIGGCDTNINTRNSPISYEQEDNHRTRNHKGHSASSSAAAAASAETSAKSYERGHKDSVYIL